MNNFATPQTFQPFLWKARKPKLQIGRPRTWARKKIHAHIREKGRPTEEPQSAPTSLSHGKDSAQRLAWNAYKWGWTPGFPHALLETWTCMSAFSMCF